MSTTQQPELSILPTHLPSELTNLLSILPSGYTTAFSTLFAVMLEERANWFINLFRIRLCNLPNTLHPVFTTRPPENPALPPDFPSLLTEFTSKLVIMHSILINIAHFSFSFPNLSSECADLLDDLHTNLYHRMNILIPTGLIRLRTNEFNRPLLQSTELEDLLSDILSALFDDLSAMTFNLKHMLITLPGVQYGEPFWHLKLFFLNLSIDFGSQQPQNYPHSNPAVEDRENQELSLKYVYEARKGAESEPENCPVCLEEMKDGDIARRLGCSHSFHVQCIDRWLKTKRSCPLCRTPINATHG